MKFKVFGSYTFTRLIGEFEGEDQYDAIRKAQDSPEATIKDVLDVVNG